MPCLSGIGLLSKIMSHKTCWNIPVISEYTLLFCSSFCLERTPFYDFHLKKLTLLTATPVDSFVQ
jgi:hypothetical protein